MEIAYVPNPCKGDKAKFEGSVVMKAPSYEERVELMLDANFSEFVNAKIDDMDNLKQDKTKFLKCMLQLVKKSYDYYVKVDIKEKGGKKTHYKSLDDLRYHKECADILQDVAMQLVNGFSMGND